MENLGQLLERERSRRREIVGPVVMVVGPPRPVQLGEVDHEVQRRLNRWNLSRVAVVDPSGREAATRHEWGSLHVDAVGGEPEFGELGSSGSCCFPLRASRPVPNVLETAELLGDRRVFEKIAQALLPLLASEQRGAFPGSSRRVPG